MFKLRNLFVYLWSSPTLLTWGNLLSSSIKLFVFTPLILVKFNQTEVALWYLFLTINSFTMIVDLGFYPTFSRIITYVYNGLPSLELLGKEYEPLISPDWDLMKRVYGTISITYIGMVLSVLIILFVFSYSPVYNVIQHLQNQLTAWIAFGLFLTGELFNFYTKKYDAVIIGTNHLVQINRWNILINFSNAIVSTIILSFNGDILALSINHLFFSLILCLRSFLLQRYICNGKFKEIQNFKLDSEVFKWCWTPVWKSAILILCSTGITQATGLFYAKVSNASELASYLFSLKMISTISQFSQAPFYSKLPIFSALRVKNDLNELIKVSADSMKKSLLVFTLGVGALAFLGDYGLQLIKSNTHLIDYKIILLMSVVWFLERHHAMHAQIYVTTNDVPFYKSAMVTGVVNISLLVLLFPHLKVIAFPISMGISNALLNNWWNVHLSIKSLKVAYLDFFKKSLIFPAILLLIICLVRLLLN